MPTHDLVLLLKKLPRPELKATLKRTAALLFQTGVIVRKLDNLGLRKLPYIMKGHDGPVREAHIFVFTFDGGPSQIASLNEALARDMDIVRPRIFFIEDKLKFNTKKHECDIALDLLKVPDRPHVKRMIEISKKKEPKPFYYGGGRDYDPLAH